MSRLESWMVWSSGLATAITGAGFFWAKYLVTPAEPWAVVNHPAEPWLLKAHIVAAPIFVFALGLVTTRHILPHVKNGVRRGRRSGLMMVWTLVPMAISGYLIQVSSAPGLGEFLIAVHVGTGGIFVVGLAGHALALVRRSLRAPAMPLEPVPPPRLPDGTTGRTGS